METEQFWGKKGDMETELELIFIDFRSSNYLPWSVVIFFQRLFPPKKSVEDPSASYEFCAKPANPMQATMDQNEKAFQKQVPPVPPVCYHKKGAFSQFKTH